VGIRRLVHNELTTLLTQGRSHESLFDQEINGRPAGAPRSAEEQSYFRHWQLPELGFRNYWYPVMLGRHLGRRPIKRRLLGEDIVLWRDGGKAHALANRCPHRGASLARGHVRFPGSGTISCPYHGWTFDGTGQLRACIQEGPASPMVGKVRTKAYPVEERLGVVWVWIGDIEPVPVEEDLPVAMKVPGVVNFIHFTTVWDTNWTLLFDNFPDSYHVTYVHRTSPKFLLHTVPVGGIPMGEDGLQFIDHDGKILEAARPRGHARPKPAHQVEYPGLGKFPRHQWWRVMAPRRRPTHNFVPGFEPDSFLHGMPPYIHTVHEDQYFTQFIIPIDRDHLYSMCAMTGKHTSRSRLWWSLYYNLYRISHDRLFIGQDHRITRHTTPGPERLSAYDREVVIWRRWAVQNARGYRKDRPSSPGDEATAPDGEAIAAARVPDPPAELAPSLGHQ
jgi:phenylpropionate dioxygenase-like ring-hydroxylating dioxygenase large terminal subunit